jgi:ABC-type uncharacterized transport system YnjBCD ATPase subunit
MASEAVAGASSLALLQQLLDDEALRLFDTPMSELDPALLRRLRGFQCGEDCLWRIRAWLLGQEANRGTAP